MISENIIRVRDAEGCDMRPVGWSLCSQRCAHHGRCVRARRRSDGRQQNPAAIFAWHDAHGERRYTSAVSNTLGYSIVRLHVALLSL